jgi:diguanylate cyclase (GGDEF)-like protein
VSQQLLDSLVQTSRGACRSWRIGAPGIKASLLRDRGISEWVHRALSPSYGARANAAQAMDELADAGDGAVVLQGPDLAVHRTDLALLSGHPAGLSQGRAASRLGMALWEVFPGHVALLDRDGVLVSVNAAWRRFGLDSGGSPTAGLGTSYLGVCDRAAAVGDPAAAEAGALVRAALAGLDTGRRVCYRCENGRWFSMQAVPVPGRYSGALVVHIDITAERDAERRWRHRALHDPLTGLPNRALLLDRLEHAVAGAAREPGRLGVLFIDLDAFKSVNDEHGHAAGDEVLREAAERMAGSVRTGDTIGRWGGDEFLVIAERLDRSTAADELATRIADSLNQPISIGTASLCIGASVGTAHLTPHQTAEELIDAADHAMQDRRQQLRGDHARHDVSAAS